MNTINMFLLALLGFSQLISIGYCFSKDEPLIGPIEYCHREKFNATCPVNRVLFIEDAKYGRMKKGRCVRLDLGHLGCVANVTAEVASRCSGRRSCDVDVSDDYIYSKNPCVQDITSYLEVTHRCIQVLSEGRRTCTNSRNRPFKVKQQSGFLSLNSGRNDVTNKNNYRLVSGGTGTSDSCSWEISAKPGQNISLILYSFVDRSLHGRLEGDGSLPVESGKVLKVLTEGTCLKVASVYEMKNEGKNILACLSQLRGHERVYTSQSHVIRLDMASNTDIPPSAAFLIKFQAQGCPHLVANGSAEVVYSGSTAKVTCKHTRKMWYLTCRGTEWIGKTEPCLGTGTKTGPHNGSDSLTSFPYGLLIAVAIGVALGVFCGGMLLTLVAVHNKKRKRRNTPGIDDENLYYGTKQQQQQPPEIGQGHHFHAHHLHQHYEPTSQHYCTEMSSLTRASTDSHATPTLCRSHAHLAGVGGGTITPEGALEYKEFCVKPEPPVVPQQQPDLFTFDKTCTLGSNNKESRGAKYVTDNNNMNSNHSSIR